MNLKLQSDIAIEGNPVWTKNGNNKDLSELTTFGQELVSEQWNRRHEYNVMRSSVSAGQWFVRFKDPVDNLKKEVASLHPVWRRTWVVVLQETSKRLTCTCGHFERRGLPCRHQAAVISLEAPASTGFSYRDCSVTWWKKYMFFSHRAVSGPVNDCLQFLFHNDILGPLMPGYYFQNQTTIPHPIVFPFGEESTICLNYSTDAINMALQKFSSIILHHERSDIIRQHDDIGLSQESYEPDTFELEQELEDIYDFQYRSPPPNDICTQNEDDNNEDDNDGDEDDHNIEEPADKERADMEYSADKVMQQSEDVVHNILEKEDLLQLSGFIKKVRESVKEQLDLLDQYSRSGNCNTSKYDLKEIAKKCIDPLKELRLQVANDIGIHTQQNKGQKYVSANCVNPTKRRRVCGAKWGLTKFGNED
jgi:hypothetical protein